MHEKQENHKYVIEAIYKLQSMKLVDYAICFIELHVAKCENLNKDPEDILSKRRPKDFKKIKSIEIKLTVLYAKDPKKFIFLKRFL